MDRNWNNMYNLPGNNFGYYGFQQSAGPSTAPATTPIDLGQELEETLCEWRKNANDSEQINLAEPIIRQAFQELQNPQNNNWIEIKLENLVLKSLPNNLSALKGINELYIDSCNFRAIPYSITGLCPELDSLRIKSCPIQHFPDWLLAQPLCSLELTNSAISSIPEHIGYENSTLKNTLTSLSIHSNKIRTIPSSVGNLTGLTYLDLSCNYLRTLPSQLQYLKNLKTLDLEADDLEYLPKWIGKLNQLEILKLRENKLQELPGSIGLLDNLEFLDLTENPDLCTLPEEIFHLPSKCTIKLDDNFSLRNQVENEAHSRQFDENGLLSRGWFNPQHQFPLFEFV